MPMPRQHPLRTMSVALALVAVVASATACGGGDGNGGGDEPAPSGVAALGAGPGGTTTSTEPEEPAERAEPEEPGGPTAGTTYPATARAYAEAVLRAWRDRDLDRLAELTTPLVYDQIVSIPGPPNQDWTFRRCEDDATVYCGFFNAVGDWASIRIDKDKFGAARAASAIEFDPTQYPNDSVAYVKAFVLAWQFGNEARMRQLSKDEVVNQLDVSAPPDFETYPEPTCCGAGVTEVEVAWGGSGVIFEVWHPWLGQPHAIDGYQP